MRTERGGDAGHIPSDEKLLAVIEALKEHYRAGVTELDLTIRLS